MPSPALLARLRASAKTEDRKSAYELAQENGFRGSVSEWLASHKGAQGEKGDVGKDGEPGRQGPRGPQGPQGPKGDVGPAPAHEWRGKELRFENPDGTWGPYTDLQGPKGDNGATMGAFNVDAFAAEVAQHINGYYPTGW